MEKKQRTRFGQGVLKKRMGCAEWMREPCWQVLKVEERLESDRGGGSFFAAE